MSHRRGRKTLLVFITAALNDNHIKTFELDELARSMDLIVFDLSQILGARGSGFEPGDFTGINVVTPMSIWNLRSDLRSLRGSAVAGGIFFYNPLLCFPLILFGYLYFFMNQEAWTAIHINNSFIFSTDSEAENKQVVSGKPPLKTYFHWLKKLFSLNFLQIVRGLDFVICQHILKRITFKSLSSFVGSIENQSRSPLAAKGSVIRGNSWQYSASIRAAKLGANFNSDALPASYGVLLDGATPKFAGDSAIMKSKEYNSELWYPALCNYLDWIEEQTGISTVIAGHPQARFSRYPPEFQGRQVIYNKADMLVRSAEFVVTRHSTAGIFAVLFNKPMICIWSSELAPETPLVRNTKTFASLFGVGTVDIQSRETFVLPELGSSSENYKRLISDRLTFARGNQTNSEIISSFLNKDQG